MLRHTSGLAALALALAPGAYAHGNGTHTAQSAQPAEVETSELGGGIYMLTGRGGNLGVLTGEDGAFIIDSQYAEMAPALLNAVSEVADTSNVRFLLNTHWHGDHTGGNKPMAGAGATIVAHDEVRTRLTHEQVQDFGSETRTTPPAPEEAWPVISYSEEMRFYLNGQTIHIHHLPHAHTDGDSAVFFEEANVIHTGDVMFNGSFPFVDITSGGTFAGYVTGLETLHELANAETRIIPGHGSEADRTDIMALKTMLEEAMAAVQGEIDAGKTLEETLEARPLEPWVADWESGFMTEKRFTSLMYADLSSDRD
ncbi:MBL fold metallo-hydrolase [Henriciella sp.]|uniref:MBL fold metallo-hydrolase n=1 Tax=Henriciella sp. TaxID=1968823 RepID=UPI00260D4B49|nr:MBL fold metallo-hydrolase [Henriciella sp.]